MIENSSAGLVMLAAEVSVTVTREEHHQSVLARYPVGAGAQRQVAVELGWCTVDSGKYRGQHAIEVRLDGRRVGELTYLMSQRYAPLVTQVSARGGRPGCAAVIQLGPRGLEVVLRLPRPTDGTMPAPIPAGAAATAVGPVPVAPQRRASVFSAHRPAWITAAVVAAVLFIAVIVGDDDSSRSTTTGAEGGTTTVAPAPTTTSTRPTTTTTTPPVTTTTTTATPVAKPPAPKPPTKRVTPPPPPPKPKPKPKCDPNYGGCVPVASDVDCAGGSGNGPAYVSGPIEIVGSDIYDLDRDNDGIACE